MGIQSSRHKITSTTSKGCPENISCAINWQGELINPSPSKAKLAQERAETTTEMTTRITTTQRFHGEECDRPWPEAF